MNKLVKKLMLVAAMLMLAAGPSFAADAIRIGLMCPLTGKWASEGQDMQQIVSLLVSEVNKAGGINGKQIELIVEDDAGDPRTASLAAQKLASAGVMAVIGTYGSAVTEASQNIIDEAEIMQIIFEHSAPNDLFGTAGYAAVADIFDKTIANDTSVDKLAEYYDKFMPSKVSGTTLDEALEKLGAVDPDSPKTVNLYAATFEDKEAIADNIAEYNRNADEDKAIEYTDYVALLMSGVTTMIDAVSYGLIAFVAISLVVSSMIGIITYISVLERTKEIGILRSIGASKRDISSVFNAETLIIGFCAGAIGIIASMLLCIPLNLIVRSLTGIDTLTAVLPWRAGIILVLISMVLTLIAGIIPSRIAAKKDPVAALRSE